MSDNRFSAAGANAGDDRFGYFAAPPPSTAPAPAAAGASQFGAGPAAPSQFGTPPGPAGAAPNPFGTPPGPTAPFGSPAPYSAPPTSSSSSKLKPILAAVGVLLLVGGGLFAFRVYKHMQPVVLPTTVDGLSVSDNAQVKDAIDSAQKSVQDQNPGLQVEFKAYGSADTRFAIVGAARGRSDVNLDFNDFGNGIGTRSTVGTSTCATSAANHVTVCERSAGDLTVLVAEVSRTQTPDESGVAAAVDEVWRQL